MAAQSPVTRTHGNAYNIFILVLTLYSLGLMVLLILPFDEGTKQLANTYDNLICVVFLIDFFYNLTGSKPTRHYLIHQRGWLDLLGSIPSFGFFQFTALLRLARLSRLARIARLLQGNNKKALIADIVQNRGQYAFFITTLMATFVLATGSILVLQFESVNPDANITNGGDALWWAIVTITTVGYGDRYPITPLGRLTAAFIMFAGIGIIGALASILASLLVAPSTPTADDAAAVTADPEQGTAAPDATGAVGAEPRTGAAAGADENLAPGDAAVAAELAGLRAEVAALRESLEARTG